MIRRATAQNIKIFDSLFENVTKGCKILYLNAGTFGKLLYIRSELRPFDIHCLIGTECGKHGYIKISVLPQSDMVRKIFRRVVRRAYQLDV